MTTFAASKNCAGFCLNRYPQLGALKMAWYWKRSEENSHENIEGLS